ncbi:hypothetical protein BJ878DRAFT_236802 [Calycina marina]|uniref:Uncharacterized protein n=1 Tax=Calycina marina TaxID=1763456 RepID=A0A9P8CJ30_9HELO|nr:hypothetical protein BJ878DRAFT_236802 [Calycina marina]
MVYVLFDEAFAKETFTFTFSAGPTLNLNFDKPISLAVLPERPFKRRRALSDIDGGDGNGERKKRRLRLHLITSRLSRPFSQPATNIANRGIAPKVSILGKHQPATRSKVRRAAIMNALRLRLDEAKACMLREAEKGREAPALKEIMDQKRSYELPPSPLGFSNYDALDLEDEIFDEENEDDGDDRSVIYSDWSIINPCSDVEGYDYLDALDGLQPDDLPSEPPPPPLEDEIVEMLRDKDRLGGCFVGEILV